MKVGAGGVGISWWRRVLSVAIPPASGFLLKAGTTDKLLLAGTTDRLKAAGS